MIAMRGDLPDPNGDCIISSMFSAVSAAAAWCAYTKESFRYVTTASLPLMDAGPFSSAALGEKNPSEIGPSENGPASIKGKDAVVTYLKDSFVYAHQAAAALTAENMLEMMQSPFGSGKSPRMAIISEITWHTFDHYDQAVVYARINGIVPPATRG